MYILHHLPIKATRGDQHLTSGPLKERSEALTKPIQKYFHKRKYPFPKTFQQRTVYNKQYFTKIAQQSLQQGPRSKVSSV